MLKVGLHHKSPRVIKLEIGLHYGCLSSDQKMSQGGKINDKASLLKSQGRRIHDGASLWEF